MSYVMDSPCSTVDAMPMITNHRSHSRRRLQEQLINAKCFTSIVSSMATTAEISSQIKEVKLLYHCMFLIVGLNNKYFYRRAVRYWSNCVVVVSEQ